jgi:hypothetical protein
MSYLNLDVRIDIDDLMSGFDYDDIETIYNWIKDNKSEVIQDNTHPAEEIFMSRIDTIKENYSRLTIEQEEQIRIIYETL